MHGASPLYLQHTCPDTLTSSHCSNHSHIMPSLPILRGFHCPASVDTLTPHKRNRTNYLNPTECVHDYGTQRSTHASSISQPKAGGGPAALVVRRARMTYAPGWHSQHWRPSYDPQQCPAGSAGLGKYSPARPGFMSIISSHARASCPARAKVVGPTSGTRPRMPALPPRQEWHTAQDASASTQA
jgi:hypothetical protein